MVAKKVEDRYPSMTAVISDLEQIIAGQSTPSSLAPPAESTDTGLTKFFQSVPAQSTKKKTAQPAASFNRDPEGSAPAPAKKPNPQLLLYGSIAAGVLSLLGIPIVLYFALSGGSKPAPSVNPQSAIHNPQLPAGYALDFDGRRTFVVTPVLYDGSHALTVEGVFTARSADTSRQSRVISNKDLAGHFGFALGIFGGSWRAGGSTAADQPGISDPMPARIGVPVHVAGVYDGRECRLYVAGKLAGTVPLPAVAPSPIPFVIGASARERRDSEPVVTSIETPFVGRIDEVRISKTARYTANFTPKPRHESDAETLALYHFDEGTGEIASDASPNQNHARIFGAKWTPVTTSGATAGSSSSAPLVAGQPVDLLSRIDFTQHPGWSLTGGELAFDRESGGRSGDTLNIHFPPPDEYQVTIVARRAHDKKIERLQLGLTVAGQRLSAWIAGNEQAHSGFDLINGMSFTAQNGAAPSHFGPLFLDDAPRTIVIRVERGALVLSVDGKELVRVPRGPTGPQFSLISKTEKLTSAPFFLNGQISYHILKLELVPLGAKAVDGDYALEFAAGGGQVTVPTLKLPTTGPVTIEGFFTLRESVELDGTGNILAGVPRQLNIISHARGGVRAHAHQVGSSKALLAIAAANTMPIGERVHVAVVWDRGQWAMFVEGRQYARGQGDPQVPLAEPTDPFTLGQNWPGLIHEAKVSKSAGYLTAYSRPERLALDADTLALWRFDEGAGDVLRDASPNKHDGQIAGATWVNADGSTIATPR